MKTIWNMAAAALAATLPGLAEADARLGEHRWVHRPILIFAAADDPRIQAQLDLFQASQPELDDRDNVVLVDTTPGSALRQRFQPAAFTVILIGLDGGEKFRRNDVVDPQTLNALIDTMPMRRQELSGSD